MSGAKKFDKRPAAKSKTEHKISVSEKSCDCGATLFDYDVAVKKRSSELYQRDHYTALLARDATKNRDQVVDDWLVGNR